LIQRLKDAAPPGGYKDFHIAWYLLFLFGSAGISVYVAYVLADTAVGRYIPGIILFLLSFVPLLVCGGYLMFRARKRLDTPQDPPDQNALGPS
jgi:hypothetical protein